MTTEERKQIASTILEQLGGGEFIRMTGSKNFVFGDQGDLSFKVPMGPYNSKVELTPMDVYTVKFSKVIFRRSGKNFGPHVVREKTVDDVYCDSLRDVFEHNTGLVTRLPKVRFA